jgi:hypothetical protein
MIPALVPYFEKLSRLHEEFKQELNSLPQEALDWTPGSEMNSVAVLAVHSAGAARYIIGEVVGGRPAQRNRAAEFRVQGWDHAGLITQLDEALAQHEQVLAELELADLEAARFSPKHDRELKVMWALVHALEHTAMHLGHVQLTRQLWQQQAKSESLRLL